MATPTGVVPALSPAETVYTICLYFLCYFVLQLASKVMYLFTKTVKDETTLFGELFTLLFYTLSVLSLMFITLQAKGSSRPATFAMLITALITVPSSLGQFDLFNNTYSKYLVPVAVTIITKYFIG